MYPWKLAHFSSPGDTISMTSYDELSKNSTKFLALTGYRVEEFQSLLPFFQVQFEKYVKQYALDGKPRTKRRYSLNFAP
jgi:hypothetical protein